jgi:hypothetical protein
MSFNTLWDIFTYFFRICKKDRKPEYMNLLNNNNDDDIENQSFTPVSTVSMLR